MFTLCSQAVDGTLRQPCALQGGQAEAEAEPEPAVQRPASPTVHLVFLSARPESYRGFTEELSFRELFEPLIHSGRLPGPPMLLLGSIRSGPLALWDYSGLARGVTCVLSCSILAFACPCLAEVHGQQHVGLLHAPGGLVHSAGALGSL